MDYKYTSTFEIKASLRKGDFAQGSFVSKANMGLDDLRSLLPAEQEIKNNPDLLYTCFNAAVANLINLNGDGITTAGAKKLVESCKLKPMNIEHSRGDIVGVITNFGFSSFGENKILTEKELSNDPFNISLAAIVWKLSNREFAEFIQSSQNEDGESYKEVSTSWEVGFNSYKLAVGSKDLRKAKIIDSEEEVESYSRFLVSMGGTGFTPEGEEVYRIIADDCRFLGCAFTTNPAAAVKGVVSVDFKSIASEMEEDDEDEGEDEEEDGEEEGEDCKCKKDKKGTPKGKEGEMEEEEEDEEEESDTSEANKEKQIVSKNGKQISPNKKNRVIKYMKYKNIDELTDHLHEAAASDVRDFINSQVDSANEKFLALKGEQEAKDKELSDALANLKAFEDKSLAFQKEIDTLKASIQAQENQTKFGERMESLKEQFDISSEASKTISKRIFGLSDEAFAEWLEDMKPLLKTKDSAESKDLEAKATAVNAPVPNAQGEGKGKKKEIWSQTLSNIKVTS
jgi:hypothetical protein